MTPRQSFIALVALALLVRPISPQAQSLADVARAEEVRRKAVSEPARVYTDKNLGDASAPVKQVQDSNISVQDTDVVPKSEPAALQRPVAAPVRDDVPLGLVASLTPYAGRFTDATPLREDLKNAEENPSPAAAPAIALPLIGWNSFTIPKTPDEIAADQQLDGREEARLRSSNRPHAILPPAHQTMNTTIGLGYVQGADWATDMNAAGKVFGLNADLTSFVTMGGQGLDIRSGHLALVDPELGWGIEAGQLFTDLRGLARGVRGSFRFLNHQSTLSFYKKDNYHHGTLAYRDELRLLHHLLVGGEVASDGSLFMRGQSFFHRLGLDTYFRKQPGKDATTDHGVGAAFDIWKGVTIRGSLRNSTAVGSTSSGNSSDWKLLSVRLPFSHGLDLTLEHNWLTSDTSTSTGSDLLFHLPAGPLQIFQRFQWGDLAYKLREVPVGFNQRQMQTVASYRAARWLTMSYQVSTEWFDDGRARQWDEVRSSFRISPKTNLELITAMPDMLQSSRLRFKFSRQLSQQFTLLAEYGKISAFQQGPELASERPRFLITVQKKFNTPTPARGGEIAGEVLDSGGDAVPGVVIHLGPYGAVTDQRGHYALENLPTGSFDLSLDKDTLPADYAYDGGRETLSISRGTRATRNLVVVPLRSLTGRVYCDDNHNGRLDPGEEIAGVVMRLNAGATTTDRSGRYGFYNLSPGKYIVEIDRERLPQGFAPVTATVSVQLEPDRAASGLDFVLTRVDKPLIMQELPR